MYAGGMFSGQAPSPRVRRFSTRPCAIIIGPREACNSECRSGPTPRTAATYPVRVSYAGLGRPYEPEPQPGNKVTTYRGG